MARKAKTTGAARSSDDASTLDEAFQYEQNKRSSLGGIAQAALAGDRSALADFAGLAQVFVERATALASRQDWVELSEWLVYALSRIASGEEPNAAFGWSKKGKGRPPGRQNMDEMRKHWVIGQHIAGMLQIDPTLSPAAAQRIAAEKHHVSPGTALNCWKLWQGIKGDK